MLTTSECLSYMYYRAGESQSNSDFATQALLYLNSAYIELWNGTCRLVPNIVANFPWAMSLHDLTIILKPKITTGTVEVNNGVRPIIFSSAPSVSLAGWYIMFGTDTTRYEIYTHTAASASATLDSVYVGTTNTVSTYKAFQLDYTVGSGGKILRIISPLQGWVANSTGDGYNQIQFEDQMSFRKYFSVATEGYPTHCCIVNEQTGVMTIRMDKYPVAEARLDVPYIITPDALSTASDPLVPRQHMFTLCNLALYYLFQDKNDDRAQAAYQDAMGGYAAMLKEVGITDASFQILKPNDEAKSV